MNLVIFRTRQRRQEKEFQNIDRQFALDDLDIAFDRFLGIGRKTENVTGIGDGAGVAPFLQHFSILGNFVLPLLGGDQIFRVDVFKPDEDAAHAGGGSLLDEIRDLVAERIDLDGKSDIEPFLAQQDHAVEQDFPILVAGEIVVGDEEALDAFGHVLAHDLFQIVGRADTALASLHVDDGAERTLIGTAAAEIDARERTRGAADVLARQKWRRFADQRRQIVHVIVERFKCAVEAVAQNVVEPALFQLAGEERNAHCLRGFDVVRQFGQHRDAARHVKAANADRQPGRQKGLGQIDRARKLVRLYADQADQGAAALALDHADDLVRPYPAVGFVEGVQAYIDAGAQYLAPARVLGQRVQAGKRVGGDSRAQPLYRIAVVVVMRRLDHHKMKAIGLLIDGRTQHYATRLLPNCPT